MIVLHFSHQVRMNPSMYRNLPLLFHQKTPLRRRGWLKLLIPASHLNNRNSINKSNSKSPPQKFHFLDASSIPENSPPTIPFSPASLQIGIPLGTRRNSNKVLITTRQLLAKHRYCGCREMKWEFRGRRFVR